MSASNMTPHPLQNANAKLDRTKNQINQLRTMIDGVLRYSSHRRIKRLDQECDEEIWSFELCTPIPQDIPVVIGEILHNLRSPLDHLACALARQHSGTDKGVFFPFGANLEAFEMQANEKCKKLSKDAVDMIRAQRPFRGGNELLWAIHDMNRSDKHREISPINLCTSANSASYLITRSGLALVLGSRTGQHLLGQRKSAEEILLMGSPTGIYECPPGLQITYGTQTCTPEESLEFLTVTPGTVFETDMRPNFDIAFKSTLGDKLESVDITLSKMATAAKSAMNSFEKAFF